MCNSVCYTNGSKDNRISLLDDRDSKESIFQISVQRSKFRNHLSIHYSFWNIQFDIIPSLAVQKSYTLPWTNSCLNLSLKSEKGDNSILLVLDQGTLKCFCKHLSNMKHTNSDLHTKKYFLLTIASFFTWTSDSIFVMFTFPDHLLASYHLECNLTYIIIRWSLIIRFELWE